MDNCLVHSDILPITSEAEMKLFTNTIGDVYVAKKQLELSQEELSKMSITDGAEMMRLYLWLHTQSKPDNTEEERQLTIRRADLIAKTLVEKLMSADSVWCLFNKQTGEPHLFSRTIARDGGYLCTPPNIRIFTKALAESSMNNYPDAAFEMKKIEKGSSGNGIENFFKECFYLNGATGIEINNEYACIAAEMIAAPPDFTGTPEISVPIMNPDLMRWILLMAQMPEVNENDDTGLIYRLYYRFMSAEMTKARFLVPMKPGKNFPEKSESAQTITLKQDTEFSLASMPGKNGRSALILYTDWKQLLKEYEGWSGSITTIADIIENHDAAVNPVNNTALGVYISKDRYDEMVRISEQ